MDCVISRRRFLKSTALVIGGAACGLPAVVHSQNANQKLNVAFIGTGGQGQVNLNAITDENVVAVCDTNANFLSAASQRFPQATKYQDFRKVFDQKNIDAVVISTANHTHYVAAMMAIRMGKHVYCETPLSHTVTEARLLAQAAHENKVATQMGNAAHSCDGMKDLVEWIQAGIIGHVEEVHCWTDRPTWPQGINRPEDTPPTPPHLDWDLWLGPAPVRPYHPAYQPFNWRGWWDFGNGALGDMGTLIMDAPIWALNLGHPSTIEAESSGVNQESAPKWTLVRYNFPAREGLPSVKLIWYDGGKMPPQELTERIGGVKNGCLFVGNKGSILLPLGGMPKLMGDARGFKAPDRILARSVNHYKEWLDACKGGKPAGSNFDYAGRLTETVLLGNVALRIGKKLEWDGASLKAVNAPEAAQFLTQPYRNGWQI